LPPAGRAAFGFALAVARTKAKDQLATASASRLDSTPAVTVGHICAPSGLPQRSLCACYLKKEYERKSYKKKFLNFFGLFLEENHLKLFFYPILFFY